MASRLLRRSGIGVTQVGNAIGWKADTVYHVGVGQYHEELDVMQEKWDGVRLIGFEPHPGLAKKLKEEYPGEFYWTALGDKPGMGTLHVKKKHKDGSSLYPHFQTRVDETYDKIEVPITTLDLLFRHAGGGHVLLWLDCEGNELNVLKGGENFIQYIEMVNVETTAKAPGTGWCSAEDVDNWLVAHGFFRQWTHTLRCHIGQCDVVYVRDYMFNPDCCNDPRETRRWKERINATA